MEKIKPIFSTNTTSVSKKRCENTDPVSKRECRRKLFEKDGELFCFYCSTIAAEDKKVKDLGESWIENREIEELLNTFKNHSLMNRDLELAEFSTFNPQNQTQKEALRLSKEFVEYFDGKSGLFFLGEPGRGKSHLAASIAKELTIRKISCIFISLPRLLTELKNTYNRNSEVSEKDILRAMQNTDLLILDDIGVERGEEEKGTSWARGKTFEVLDSRLGKSNVITTNYGSKELIKMYGERDFSRMVQNTTPIKIDGKNYRFQGF